MTVAKYIPVSWRQLYVKMVGTVLRYITLCIHLLHMELTTYSVIPLHGVQILRLYCLEIVI
jgi:hypothetical protein